MVTTWTCLLSFGKEIWQAKERSWLFETNQNRYGSISCLHRMLCVISAFHRDVGEISTLLGCYAVYSGYSLPTFRDTLSVLSSRVMKSKKRAYLETSVGNNHYTLSNIPGERRAQDAVWLSDDRSFPTKLLVTEVQDDGLTEGQ
jgi:hypothetical protein